MEKMPTKTTKKPAAKKVVAKKTPAKKPAKRVVKSAPAVAAKPVVTEIPAAPCCHCTKRKKFFYLAGMFILGFLVAQLFCCCCGCKHHKRMPKLQFVDGCVDMASVKCPKMLEKLSAADADNNGCITKVELRAAKKHMRHHEKPVAEQPDVNVDDAIAPVME